MRTISLKVMDEALEITNQTGNANEASKRLLISYNPDQSIGANLENMRVRLAGIDFDVIVVVNPLTYSFSDTIVGINHQRIDIGLALTNMFNVPVVALPTVRRLGLQAAIDAKKEAACWHLDYYGQYDGKRNYGQEAMLTVGNGYFGLRGAYVEAHADKNNYPGMYVAGLYNQTTTNINGRDITNEDLVNMPNAQFMTFGVDNATPFKIQRRDIRDIYRSLDLRTGALTTTMIIVLGTGHELCVQTTKVADMEHWHRFAIRYQITPLNFSGSLQVYSGIDGGVRNTNVDRYQQFESHHVDVSGMASAGDQITLAGQTTTSNIHFTVGSRLTTPDADADLRNHIKVNTTNTAIAQIASIPVATGQTYTFDKTVALYTDRECASAELDQHVTSELNAASFTDTSASAKRFFTQLWTTSDTTIDGDITSQKLLRVNTFHLFTSATALASGQLDASVGARGLHGEAYRGHVFWDEMFVMPFYAAHYPAIAKQMLMYRYNRLGAAKDYAHDNGRQGAMYPWQSGSDGSEQSQSVHLNPITNTWDPDNSRRQRHVSLAVAYDAWLYWHITGDEEFMHNYGIVMILAIAKFWLSMTAKDEATGKYSIHRVMGPDEFHEGYPNADEPGLTDNAYTNIGVAWLFRLVEQMQTKVHDFATILNQSDLCTSDLAQMTTIRHNLHLDISEDGIIGQFSGYFKLPELDFDQYRKQYGDIARIDRILKAEGKTPDAYQVAKQADTLMASFILNQQDVADLIADMGYTLPDNYFEHNLHYYLARTTHGSTLSRIVYAYLERLAGYNSQSWQLYRQALFSDYYDIQGGTTAEGIHLGVMGATLDVAQRLFGGVNLLGDKPAINPRLPKQWAGLHFNTTFQGATLACTITHNTITITSDKDIAVTVLGKPVRLVAGNEFATEY